MVLVWPLLCQIRSISYNEAADIALVIWLHAENANVKVHLGRLQSGFVPVLVLSISDYSFSNKHNRSQTTQWAARTPAARKQPCVPPFHKELNAVVYCTEGFDPISWKTLS